uniref:Uncharacterized protein n=1 Tax=Rhizophora mucronata TaxID=61149 RepID=A0A2P2P655_RHIMU
MEECKYRGTGLLAAYADTNRKWVSSSWSHWWCCCCFCGRWRGLVLWH